MKRRLFGICVAAISLAAQPALSAGMLDYRFGFNAYFGGFSLLQRSIGRQTSGRTPSQPEFRWQEKQLDRIGVHARDGGYRRRQTGPKDRKNPLAHSCGYAEGRGRSDDRGAQSWPYRHCYRPMRRHLAGRRYDAVFSQVGSEKYKGPAGVRDTLKCKFDFVRRAGYKKKDKRWKGLTGTVWLQTLGEGLPMLPVRVQVETSYGTALVHMVSARPMK